MRVEASIGLSDQRAIESLFAPTGFVASREQNRGPAGIEGESHPPFSSGRGEAQLLHVGVARAFERIHSGPAQLRAEALENEGQGKYLRPDVLVERIEFGIELIGKRDCPWHIAIMA